MNEFRALKHTQHTGREVVLHNTPDLSGEEIFNINTKREKGGEMGKEEGKDEKGRGKKKK